MIFSKDKTDYLEQIRKDIYLKYGVINTSYKREIFKFTINFLMTEFKLRSVDLSLRTSISESVLSEYIAGKYTPRGKNLFKIANTLLVNPDWLIGVPNSKMNEFHNNNFFPNYDNYINLRAISSYISNEYYEDESFNEIYIDILENITKLNFIGLKKANCFLSDFIKISDYTRKD